MQNKLYNTLLDNLHGMYTCTSTCTRLHVDWGYNKSTRAKANTEMKMPKCILHVQ